MLAMAVEYSHAEDEALPERCENWARAYVDRMRRQTIGSIESRFRWPTGWHWDYDARYGHAPDARPKVDVVDAALINGAWQSIPDAYHQALLGGHYVRRWSPNKCSREALKIAGLSDRVQITDHAFERILQMAHDMLEAQLALPAVFRRARLVSRVRIALELDVWGQP